MTDERRRGQLSRWCAAGTIEVDVLREDFKTWDTVTASGHKWCQGERWHDEYHGKDPGCCAGPEERESWACECRCHAECEVSAEIGWHHQAASFNRTINQEQDAGVTAHPGLGERPAGRYAPWRIGIRCRCLSIQACRCSPSTLRSSRLESWIHTASRKRGTCSGTSQSASASAASTSCSPATASPQSFSCPWSGTRSAANYARRGAPDGPVRHDRRPADRSGTGHLATSTPPPPVKVTDASHDSRSLGLVARGVLRGAGRPLVEETDAAGRLQGDGMPMLPGPCRCLRCLPQHLPPVR